MNSPVSLETHVTAQTPAGHACDFALRTAWREVGNALTTAVATDSRHAQVHHLRVSTRRLQAVLKAFRDWVSPLPFRELLDLLREIRRLSAKVRTQDVLLQFLEARLPHWNPAFANGGGAIRDYWTRRRSRARRKLRQRLEHLQSAWNQTGEHFCTALEMHLLRTRQKQPAFGLIAVAALHRRLTRLWEQFDPAPVSPTRLHDLRIQLKRLRYVGAATIPVLHTGLEEQFFPPLRTLQEFLGNWHDAQAGLHALKKLRKQLHQSRDRRHRCRLPGGSPLPQRELELATATLETAFQEQGARGLRQFQSTWAGFATTDFRQPMADLLRAETERLTLPPADPHRTRASSAGKNSLPQSTPHQISTLEEERPDEHLLPR